MNFALMFALAVGIDYALFLVVRFRAALRAGSSPEDAVAETMDSAGRAVLVSGVAVLASLAAVMLVPSQPFRTSALGILLAVGFVLAASLTLLPALLARLGPRIDRFALPWAGAVQHRSEAFARWGRLIWRRPVVMSGLRRRRARRARPAGPRSAHGHARRSASCPRDASARAAMNGFRTPSGPARPPSCRWSRPRASRRACARRSSGARTSSRWRPRSGAAGWRSRASSPSPESGHHERLRSRLPDGALVGGARAEAHDLERALARRLPLVYGVVVAVGFALLLVVVRAPIAAAAAVLMNLLATAAAFGVARLIFQDGHGEGLLGFSSQGFVDAWAPIFFFALMFALAMDYTVFLLSSVRAELERPGDPRTALVEGLAGSGRVINAAGGVMVVVFFTFALSGPLAPKEMGTILGVAVLLDTLLVRLLLLPAVLRLLGPSRLVDAAAAGPRSPGAAARLRLSRRDERVRPPVRLGGHPGEDDGADALRRLADRRAQLAQPRVGGLAAPVTCSTTRRASQRASTRSSPRPRACSRPASSARYSATLAPAMPIASPCAASSVPSAAVST